MLIRILLMVLLPGALYAQTPDLAEGDIVFQSNISPQCKAIELATHSRYSHCGIVFKKNDAWYVLEAVQPVRETPFAEWIARNRGRYAVKRLRGADSLLTPAVVNKMKSAGQAYLGKDYDSYFEWSDQRIYCSELVWKIYKSATGLEVGRLQPMREYDLTHPLVKATMQERYGNNIPLEEKMVSPGNIFDSKLLVTVVGK